MSVSSQQAPAAKLRFMGRLPNSGRRKKVEWRAECKAPTPEGPGRLPSQESDLEHGGLTLRRSRSLTLHSRALSRGLFIPSA